MLNDLVISNRHACQAQLIFLLKIQVLRRREHESYRQHIRARTGQYETFQHLLDHNSWTLSKLDDRPNFTLISLVRSSPSFSLKSKFYEEENMGLINSTKEPELDDVRNFNTH